MSKSISMNENMSKNSPDLLILNTRASGGVGPYRGETTVSPPTYPGFQGKINMHLKHTTEDINLQREYSKMETLRMISKEQSAEPSLSKIRVLELENCVILMCEKCGETWNPDKLNSWVCPNGCNRF